MRRHLKHNKGAGSEGVGRGQQGEHTPHSLPWLLQWGKGTARAVSYQGISQTAAKEHTWGLAAGRMKS